MIRTMKILIAEDFADGNFVDGQFLNLANANFHRKPNLNSLADISFC